MFFSKIFNLNSSYLKNPIKQQKKTFCFIINRKNFKNHSLFSNPFLNFNKKLFSSKTTIIIPYPKLSFQFSRSSGPGGQNVNKVNTKAELRIKLDTADWIPEEVKQRLKEEQANKINKEGELIITGQTTRTQEGNIKECIEKLEEYLAEAEIPPFQKKETEPPVYAKENRIKEKKTQTKIKEGRNWKSLREY